MSNLNTVEIKERERLLAGGRCNHHTDIACGRCCIDLSWLAYSWTESWRWLPEDEISDIKSFMLSGALVSVAMSYFNRFIQRQ
ncbi:MAG: hypothetical protein OXC63_15885 [Aestuariivita sp.]|nr:hypothetical protein [Aestuariivita sp.]MCY4346838.1 hypothetical protein [Aestuariivita sp.]